jgi:hypothetical protein
LFCGSIDSGFQQPAVSEAGLNCKRCEINNNILEITMTKPTNPKRREAQTTPTSGKNESAAVGRSSGPMQRAAIPSEAATSRPTAAEGRRPTHDQIAARAFGLWIARGMPAGSDREDWFEAERLLRVDCR